MSATFTESIVSILPWLVPVLIVLVIWGWMNWKALSNPDNKAFGRVVGWLREDSFGQLYLGFLGGLMDRVGDWIGDRQRLSQDSIAAPQTTGIAHRVFGFNPFTTKSYEKCLWLAFMYPVLAYLLAWAMGAEGQVGNISLFGSNDNELILWQRWSIMGGMLLSMLIGLWFVLRCQGWRQWFALAGVLLLEAGISSWIAEQIDTGLLLILTLSVVFFMLFILLYLGGWLTGLVLYRSIKKAHQEIYNLAFAFAGAVVVSAGIGAGIVAEVGSAAFASASTVAVAGAVAVTFAGTAAGAVAGAIAVAGAVAVGSGTMSGGIVDGDSTFANAFAGAGSFAGAGAGAGILAVSGSGIIIIILQALQQWSNSRGYMQWFWLIYSALLISLGAASLSYNANSGYMLFILLWLLLPLVNAPLDWLSLGFTRGLLQAVRTGNHSGWRTLIWAAADLLLAFIFLFLITAVLVGVTALGNSIAGKTLVDIGCILHNLKTNASHPDHWWIYFMLLSTLIPTLFHFALAGGAATLWLPRKWRTQLADGLKDDIHKTFAAWVYLTLTPVIGFFLMPLALLGGLWWLLTLNGGALGTLLLSWAITLAGWADPSMALVCQ